MARKKKKGTAEQAPWCYYCDRVFSDESTLIQHQKAKHFKCTTCHRKLTSASGLRVHCHQVHRFTLDKVPSAIPGKDSIELEVFGMSGVPGGATPGLPAPEEDEPPSKAAKTDTAGVPDALPPQLVPPLQPLYGAFHGVPPVMAPHFLHAAPAVHLQPQLCAAPTYRYGLPQPALPGMYPLMAPPWPPPSFLRGSPARLPGHLPQQPAFPLSSAQPAALVAPLFPIATDGDASASQGNDDMSINKQILYHTRESTTLIPVEQHSALTPLPSVAPRDVSEAKYISLEEVRARHPKYKARVNCQ